MDGEQFDYYDSNIRKDVPTTDWIKKVDADDPDYWNRQTQILQRHQEAFKANVGVLMKRFSHTEGEH